MNEREGSIFCQNQEKIPIEGLEGGGVNNCTTSSDQGTTPSLMIEPGIPSTFESRFNFYPQNLHAEQHGNRNLDSPRNAEVCTDHSVIFNKSRNALAE